MASSYLATEYLTYRLVILKDLKLIKQQNYALKLYSGVWSQFQSCLELSKAFQGLNLVCAAP